MVQIKGPCRTCIFWKDKKCQRKEKNLYRFQANCWPNTPEDYECYLYAVRPKTV